jgi:DNA-directed RNA polymerase subunit RPC12/RpoP
MSHEITCFRCSRAIVPSDHREALRVGCAHCGEKFVNLAALKTRASMPLSCLAALLIVLCMALAPLVFAAALCVLAELLGLLGVGYHAPQSPTLAWILYGGGGCLAYGLLVHACVLAFRAEKVTEGRGPKTVAAVCDLALFAMVTALLLFLATRGVG